MLKTYTFNVGDTKSNPLGMTAIVRAHSKAEAALLLNSFLNSCDQIRPFSRGTFTYKDVGVEEILIWSNRLTVSLSDAILEAG
ncbi:MAG TPA: hypothetical protein VNF68_11605 [Candidatus Baltobacteraceae bacterium]|nr:hypothetical protein [Candidatus Baltobacteraceae bacterium]